MVIHTRKIVMRYGLLERDNEIKLGDEYFYGHSNIWKPVTKDLVGFKYDSACSPIRRLIDRPKPVEVFIVPFGTWTGCAGEVFMDGDDKKIRLHNVFYGAKPLVIDFPIRKKRGDNIVLEDEDLIQSGDQFSYTCGFLLCESTIGMTVKEAKNEFSSPVYFVRPTS